MRKKMFDINNYQEIKKPNSPKKKKDKKVNNNKRKI